MRCLKSARDAFVASVQAKINDAKTYRDVVRSIARFRSPHHINAIFWQIDLYTTFSQSEKKNNPDLLWVKDSNRTNFSHFRFASFKKGQILLNGLASAHYTTIHDKADPFMAGTTTALGGVIARVRIDPWLVCLS